MRELISVVITTKNEEKNIARCLKSIKKQTYTNYEIIVVDNNSIDTTVKIAQQFTSLIFNKGPERSAQRNYGAKKSKGKYLLFLDADMVLTQNVLQDCLAAITKKNKLGGIVIPEKSFGTSWWAKAKALERSFYENNDSIEAARFYPKEIFISAKGFDESLTGPEDWDLSQRVAKKYPLGRIKSYILHNEGNLSLFTTMKKKYYYSKKMLPYLKKTNKMQSSRQINLLKRYALFFSNPKKLFKDPVLGVGMLFMKTAEFIAAGVGLGFAKFSK